MTVEDSQRLKRMVTPHIQICWMCGVTLRNNKPMEEQRKSLDVKTISDVARCRRVDCFNIWSILYIKNKATVHYLLYADAEIW